MESIKPQENSQNLSDILKNVKIDNIHVEGPLNDKDISYQQQDIKVVYKHNNRVIKEKITEEQGILVSKFVQTIKQRDLQDEFLKLSEVTWSKAHAKRICNEPIYSDQNRYVDILPFNDTRVLLSKRKNKLVTDQYINANYIHSPLGNDRKIIACQGPKSNTVESFWRMIIQENVTLIVCVCRLEEGKRTKCHKYWPNPDSLTDEQFHNVFEGFVVSTKEERAIGKTFHERICEIVTDDGKKQTVRQLHYVGWPDHGVPSGESMNDFNTLINEFVKMILTSQESEKAIVHCSAGIGRTGTSIAILYIIINLCAQKNAGIQDPKLSVFSIVRRLREQRMGMVQMPDQYQFIYLFLAHWLKQNGFIQ